MNALLHGTKGFELFPEDLDLFRPDSRREAYAPFAALPVHGLCAELSQNRFRIRRSRPRIAGTQGDLQIGPRCCRRRQHGRYSGHDVDAGNCRPDYLGGFQGKHSRLRLETGKNKLSGLCLLNAADNFIGCVRNCMDCRDY